MRAYLLIFISSLGCVLVGFLAATEASPSSFFTGEAAWPALAALFVCCLALACIALEGRRQDERAGHCTHREVKEDWR